MRTIGSVIDRHKGIGPGYDFLRVALAVCVVVWHAWPIALGMGDQDRGLFWFPNYAILGAFFALSGYLITGSATRLNLKNFLINRGLRIFPALIVETFLSAVLLGFLYSSLPTSTYFTHPDFYGYFTSLFGYIKYNLPGVFDSNPIYQVNLSLWTVPYELLCYAIMSAFMLLGALKRWWIVVGAAAACIMIGLILAAAGSTHTDSLDFSRAFYAVFVGRASRLIVCFILGIAAYLLRYRLPYDWRAFFLCAGICVVEYFVWSEASIPVLNLVMAVPVVYMTVFLGATELPTLPVFHRGDYSYGVYLYGAPIQQAIRASFPTVTSPALNVLLSLPLIILFAMFSWHVIEKPILNIRRRFSFVARMRLEEQPVPVVAGLPTTEVGTSANSSNDRVIR